MNSPAVSAILNIHQTVGGDGDAMRVAADIVEHLRRSGERRFRIDAPFGVFGGLEMTGELCRIFQVLERLRESEFTGVEGLLEIG